MLFQWLLSVVLIKTVYSSYNDVVETLPPDTSNSTTCLPRRPVDVIFSVDDIGLGARRTDMIMSLLLLVSAHMEHRDDNIKIALVTNKKFHSRPLGKSYFFSNSFHDKLRKLHIPNQEELFRRSRRQSKYGRRKVQKTIVHFIDENILLTKDILKEALKNKRGKIQTYLVAIGRQFDEKSLSSIASKPFHHHVIRIDSYESLDKKWFKILERICTGW